MGEEGRDGSPFELRITTRTQPFGYQRHVHTKLSRHDRKKAREDFDKATKLPLEKEEYDFNLFGKPDVLPWKASDKRNLCIPLQKLWSRFRSDGDKGIAGIISEKFPDQSTSEFLPPKIVESLLKSFEQLSELEVPLILIPEYISNVSSCDNSTAPAPLTLLFERIGRNGASLSNEDLLFSMIKQQWPEAHDLVAGIHKECGAKHLMSATDYVMTAYRLAAADIVENKIADNPRPNPNDFHRHLSTLIVGNKAPLRIYLEESTLSSAFDSLYNTLKYKNIEDIEDIEDIGLPDMMLPHLSRGLIQVLLRWFMVNKPDENMISKNRNKIIAFTLFWYLCILNEDKASKLAFSKVVEGDFPAEDLYKELSKVSDNEAGLALPLILPKRLGEILVRNPSQILRNSDGIFANDKNVTIQERDLYRRFCWWRKPILLWLQREYVDREFENQPIFAGVTDEDAVPYDYDHLCPQNHWGSDWRNITRNLNKDVESHFYSSRSDVGNCIGNLHVLESSLNRSFGDAPLEWKLKQEPKWLAKNSLLTIEEECSWITASPDIEDGNEHRSWDGKRLQAFQCAVEKRAFALYASYFDALGFEKEWLSIDDKS